MNMEVVNKLIDHVLHNEKWRTELKKLLVHNGVYAFHEKGMHYMVAASKELKVKSTWQERDWAIHYIYREMLSQTSP